MAGDVAGAVGGGEGRGMGVVGVGACVPTRTVNTSAAAPPVRHWRTTARVIVGSGSPARYLLVP